MLSEYANSIFNLVVQLPVLIFQVFGDVLATIIFGTLCTDTTGKEIEMYTTFSIVLFVLCSTISVAVSSENCIEKEILTDDVHDFFSFRTADTLLCLVY